MVISSPLWRSRELPPYVLTTNNFEFDNKEFLQVGGTAMGTKLANLCMGDFGGKCVETYHLSPSLGNGSSMISF